MSKQRQIFLWDDLSTKGRMYLVLALCCLMVAVAAAVGLALVGKPEVEEPPLEDQPLVGETNYNMNENVIDAGAYADTILPQGEDVGESYVAETLFLGDSNTARMYRLFDYCSYDNAIGSVGMAARSLANYACVGFAGYSNYVTMPQAVALMQPKRVLITFGTNDLNPNSNTETFITNYETGIKAVQEAYPSVDIIINSIPPLGAQRSSQYLTQSQVDEWNLAIVEMCQENGWKFLNSAEILKDNATGFARSGYVEGDGIHLTRAALDAFFNYFRTHSYVTEDDRPALQTVPQHNDDRDVTQTPAALPSATPEASIEPSASPSATPTATPSATPEPTLEPTATPTPSATPEESATPSTEPTDPAGEATSEPVTSSSTPAEETEPGPEGSETPGA